MKFIYLISFSLIIGSNALADEFAKDFDAKRVTAYENSFNFELMNKLFDEVKNNFTIYGNPISPMVFNSLEPYASDLMPSLYELDLNASVNSGQFYGETYLKDIKICNRNSYQVSFDENSGYQYTLIDKPAEDLAIILTGEYGVTSPSKRLQIFKLSLSAVNAIKNEDKLTTELPVFASRYLISLKPIFSLNLPNIDGECHYENGSFSIISPSAEKLFSIDLKEAIK